MLLLFIEAALLEECFTEEKDLPATPDPAVGLLTPVLEPLTP